MRDNAVMHLLLAALPLLAAVPQDAPRTVPLTVHRPLPQADRHRELLLRETGCEGSIALRSLESTDGGGAATIEKLAKGPAAAPTLVLEVVTDEGTQTGAAVLENAMIAPEWENGGTFRSPFRMPQTIPATSWKSVELRCTANTPFSATGIPPHVTYKQGDAKQVIAAANKLAEALRSERAFAAINADESLIIGPDLYAAMGSDPALAVVESPTMRTIDPATKKARAMLRIKGEKELAAFAAAMQRYLGTTKPRIRAATSTELAAHWLNIGWDIEEPLLVADYGAHRLVIDMVGDEVLMVDELPR